MKNHNPDNYNQKNELSIIELFYSLIHSKKLVITITLICTIAATGYAYTIKPSYKSSAEFVVGNFQGDQIINLNDFEKDLGFLFTKFQEGYGKLSLEKHGHKYVTVIIIGPSLEKNSKILKDITDHIHFQSKKIITTQLKKEEESLNEINTEIKWIEEELSILLKLQNPANSESRRIFISELGLKLNQLKYNGKSLDDKLKSPDLYEHTKLFNEIDTLEINPRVGFPILLGFLVGLTISITIILLKQMSFNELKEENP